MKVPRLLFAGLFATGLLAGTANACSDSSNMSRYFSYQRPVRHGNTIMLRVRIDRIEGAIIHATLDRSYEHLSRDGTVRIRLPEYPYVGNCLEMGPTEGPVFVIGTLRRTASGELSLVAGPTQSAPRRRMARRPQLDHDIVYPADLPPVPAPRHKGEQ